MKNTKTTKRALVSSALVLILCVSMFIGNTFAWFTDTASTSVNRIQAGNLDIEVYYATPADLVDGKVPDDAWKKISADESVFDEDALWEPGYTQIVYFKLVNEGSLALKYQLRINIVNEVLGKNKSGEDIQLSNYIQAYVVNSPDQNYLFATRDDALNPKGAPDPFSDTLYNAANLGIDTTSNGEDTELSLSSEHVLVSNDDVFYATLVLWMPDTVGNEANHDGTNIPSIDLGINVYATQYTYEYDSYGKTYDEDADYYGVKVSSADDLKSAITDGDSVVLTDDVTFASDEIESIGTNNHVKKNFGTALLKVTESVDIDLNGSVIEYDGNAWEGILATDGATVNVYDSSANETGGITLTNSDGCALYATNNATLNIYGGNYTTSNIVLVVAQYGGTVNIYGGTYTSTCPTNDSNYQYVGTHLLNGVDDGPNYSQYTNIINVYGGSFKGFNPGDSKTNVKVADGYKVEQVTLDGETWYNVVPEN